MSGKSALLCKLTFRREATAAELSKERSAVIRENKEMMMKHKANATYMNDLAKVCFCS